MNHDSRELLNLHGRTALVTGAGRGVGRRVALHLAEHGAGTVVVNDFNADRAEIVAEEVRARGGQALAVQADVSDFSGVSDMFQAAREACGSIEILVNNAGNAGPHGNAQPDPPFWTQEPGDWEKYLDVNLYGVLNCTRHALPSMVENRYGRVVTIISDAGRVGEAGMEVYSGAKAAAAGFVRSVARSVGRYGITANSIALAATRTPFVAHELEDTERSKTQLKRYIIRRFGEPEDAANMALFLASEAASWITGQTYPVNGGYSVGL